MKIALNPTVTGLVAVIVWGLALPIMRIVASRIGIAALFGFIFTGAGCLGLIVQASRGRMLPDRAIFRNPYLYGRWIFFAAHELCICTAMLIVSKANVPFVILLNYLWPTAIILCSVLIANVRITRWLAFTAGTMIVIASLALELVGPHILQFELFDLPLDRLAYLLAFCGAVSWGLYCAISKKAGEATGGGDVIPLFQLSLGLALPLSFIPGVAMWDHLTCGLFWLLCLWCFVQFLAYLSWDFGMRRGSVVVLSLCADFIPWISLLAASILLGVTVGRTTIVAAVCLVAGAMITRYGTLQRSLEATDEPPIF